MNRFRSRKKAKEPTEGIVRASIDSDGSILALKSSKKFRRGKKDPEPERKVELDISTALPSTDAFRTSLLMSGLSARFSMLREQDDPNSKIGKASDDSVLFPTKRQSRINELRLGFQGLSDIAEVSSINGSIRPPFAFRKTDSWASGDGTEADPTHGGSIMNRSKPGEGNVLFGGRQKIYKIPASASPSTKSSTEGGKGGMGGRALYEHDVSQTVFQKLREREREQQWLERREAEQNAQLSRAESPPPSGYNRNRETSSTTSSGGPSITRSSTAATSFTSQRTPSLSGPHTPATTQPPLSNTTGPDRTMTKGRRLYETGLDQHLHEQQSSAMSRIDILARQRTLGAHTPPPGLSSPVGVDPTDRWDRQQIAGKSSLPNMRAASPTPHAPVMGTFDFGLRSNLIETKPAYGLASPPLSPPMSDGEDQGVFAVQPNDRGKATALGTFSKPALPYDENKYSQRQLQMQQGRETPPLRKPSPSSSPRSLVSREQQQQMGRNLAESNATFVSGRSRSTSSAQRQLLPEDRSLHNSYSSKAQAIIPGKEALDSGTFPSSPNVNSSESSEDIEVVTRPKLPFIFPSQIYHQNQQARERPPESQHPANRTRTFESGPESPWNGQQRPPTRGTDSPSQLDKPLAPRALTPPVDSPTLGLTTGLSGMVRQHLRIGSNTSSVYGGAPYPGPTSRFPCDSTEALPQNEYSTRNIPWETDGWDEASYGDTKFGLECSLENGRGSVVPPPLSIRVAVTDGEVQEPRESPWQREMQLHHTRDGSTETQKEQQDFKAELATRRRRVQENLKSLHQTQSRSVSPAPIPDWPADDPVKTAARTRLLIKSSHGSLIGSPKEVGQSKAMKMLGLGNATISSSPSPRKSDFIDENAWREEEEEMLQGVPRATTKAFRQARRDAQRDRERQVALKHQQKLAAGASADDSAWSRRPSEDQPKEWTPINDRAPSNIRTGRRPSSRERASPPVLHWNGNSQESKITSGTISSTSRPASRTSRDRSSSDTSGRSKSRNGRYKDDLAKAMAEGAGSSAQLDLEPPSARLMLKSPGTPRFANQLSPLPSPMTVLQPATRSRSNSKTAVTGYLDSHNLQPAQTGGAVETGLPPRPSPVIPYSVNPTPPLSQPSPDGSEAKTPVTNQGFQAQGSEAAPRKRSINKSDISEPIFVSSTSRVPTIDLPAGSSLQNGFEAPPIPPVNPRRRQTRVIFGFGRKDEGEETLSLPVARKSSDEASTFSASEGESRPRFRHKLRKSSSDGGKLNARAKQAASAAPSPAVPSGFPRNGSPPRRNEGEMF